MGIIPVLSLGITNYEAEKLLAKYANCNELSVEKALVVWVIYTAVPVSGFIRFYVVVYQEHADFLAELIIWTCLVFNHSSKPVVK